MSAPQPPSGQPHPTGGQPPPAQQPQYGPGPQFPPQFGQPGQPYGQQTQQYPQYPQPPYGAAQQYPPGPYGPPGGPYPPQPRNGFGIAALVLAIVGLVFCAFVVTGFISVVLGALAVLFGFLGLSRVRSGEATNKGLTITGLALGFVSVVAGIVCVVIVITAATRIAGTLEGLDNLDRPGLSGSSPSDSSGVARPPTGLATLRPLPSGPPSASSGGQNSTTAPGGFTWDDGLQISVSAPRAASFTDTACCPAAGGSGIAFTIQIVNGTTGVVDADALLTWLTVNGVDTEQVFDSSNGFGSFSDSIAPGQSLTADVAFDAPPAGGTALRLEVGGIEYDSAFFTATL